MQRALLCLLSLVLTAGVRAQGVLSLTGSYAAGSIGSSFASPPCFPPSLPSCSAEFGTGVFQPNGKCTFMTSELDLCPGGIASATSTNVSCGYEVDEQGQLVLDFDLEHPGEETSTLFLRADGTVAVEGRVVTSPDNYLSVLVKLSNGLGTSSLNGTYHVARLVQFNGAPAYSVRTELGVMSFNGAGGWSESGLRHSIVSGSTATNTPYSANGSYAVAADGMITGTDIDGAMSSDGEFFFWVRRAAAQSEVELTVGVRRGTSYTPGTFGGDWGIASFENFVMNTVSLETSLIFAATTPLTPMIPQATGPAMSQGSVVLSSFEASTTAFGTSSEFSVETDPYTLSSMGNLVVGISDPALGGVGAKGTFCLGMITSSDGAGMFLGVLRCPWPHSFGLATPGTGSIAPLAATSGGFPHLGNANYGLGITNALGGAPGVLLLSANTSAGIPFLGGTIWLDPSLLLSVPVALTGTPGQAGAGSGFATIGVPNLPSLDGAAFAFQGFVADAGAPRGLAMTQALVVGLCR